MKTLFEEKKLYAVIILLLFILISFITANTVYNDYKGKLKETISANKLTAQFLSTLIYEHQKAATSILLSYAHRPLMIDAIKKKDFQNVIRHLKSLRENNNEIDTLFITDRQGTFWANYPVDKTGYGADLSYRDWYKGVSRQWKPYVSPVYRLIVRDKNLAVAISVPVFDRNGTVIGIMGASQRIAFLATFIKENIIDPKKSVTLLDQEGNIIFSSTVAYEESITKYPVTRVLEKALAGVAADMEIADAKDKGSISHVSIAPVKGIGWSVIVGKEKDVIVQELYKNSILTVVTGFVIFLFLTVSLLYFSKEYKRRKTRERQISEERYKTTTNSLEYAESVINTVREPLISLDQDLRVVTVSRSFCEFFKVTSEETVGQLIYDLGNKQWDIPKLRELLETILPQKASFDNYEVEHDFATIGRRIMLLNARQIQRVLGKERIILLAIEDITERKEIEREVIKARDTAESANKELEAFSYSVSHDLRTPLRSIDGFSQALLEDYQDTLDDTGKSYLDRVRKATQHMGNLIDDMLKLSRVTRSAFYHASVDLSTMVRNILEKLQKDNPDRTVDVIIQEGVFVNGDPNLLNIALENLVGNAWKFTSREEKSQVEFGTIVKERKTTCFIRDNGVGFDMTYVDKLFGAFQRLHTTLEFPGTGIGLATAQRIINRHGGQIWVEAKVGKGATFYFTLPG